MATAIGQVQPTGKTTPTPTPASLAGEIYREAEGCTCNLCEFDRLNPDKSDDASTDAASTEEALRWILPAHSWHQG